jgi:hypothetical protein
VVRGSRSALTVGALIALSAAMVTGCGSTAPLSPSTSILTDTVTTTLPASTFRPPPPTSVAPLPPGSAVPPGEAEQACPYIASTPQQDPKTNVADIVGSHVYRTTVLTRSRPVDCRFYFYAPPYAAVADIDAQTFATELDARNAMIRTAEAGQQVIGQPHLAPDVPGVAYRTVFYGPDGGRDWACAFAAGAVLVVVHTQRTDTAAAAVYLAQAVAGRF